MDDCLELAQHLATQPGFDNLFDPNPATQLIEPYWDPLGFPTQGYGELLSRIKFEDLAKYPAIPVEEALARLTSSLRRAWGSVRRLCPVSMTAGQAAALTDFAFNCGAGNLQTSALRQAVIRGDFEFAADQFLRWDHAGGRRLAGLTKRRIAERTLFLSSCPV